MNDFVKNYLCARGMFESQADEVFELIKNAPENTCLADRWNEPLSNYPERIKAILRSDN